MNFQFSFHWYGTCQCFWHDPYGKDFQFSFHWYHTVNTIPRLNHSCLSILFSLIQLEKKIELTQSLFFQFSFHWYRVSYTAPTGVEVKDFQFSFHWYKLSILPPTPWLGVSLSILFSLIRWLLSLLLSHCSGANLSILFSLIPIDYRCFQWVRPWLQLSILFSLIQRLSCYCQAWIQRSISILFSLIPWFANKDGWRFFWIPRFPFSFHWYRWTR